MNEILNIVKVSELLNNEEKARAFFENIRWKNGIPTCPHCNNEGYRINRKPSAGRKAQKGVCKCRNKECRKQFTVTVGTIFEASHIKIGQRLMCIYLVCSSKKSISANQIHKMLGVSYKTAWFMCHRVRYAMAESSLHKLAGKIEADETYVGGKPRKYASKNNKRGRGTKKTPVAVLIQRDGDARSKPMKKLALVI